jgi:hypothetical protein
VLDFFAAAAPDHFSQAEQDVAGNLGVTSFDHADEVGGVEMPLLRIPRLGNHSSIFAG